MDLTTPPARWATRSGRDQHGAFADLDTPAGGLRFRWLAPTRLEHGVWMSERLCSRALHEELAGPLENAPAPPELTWVSQVTWTAAMRACNELSRRHEVGDKMVFRLPLEGEWARARAMSTGVGEPTLTGIEQLPGAAWEWTMDKATWDYSAGSIQQAVMGARGQGPYRVLCGERKSQWGEAETRRLEQPWVTKPWLSYRICRGRPSPM